VTEAQGAAALFSTTVAALVVAVIVAAWTWGLGRIGARWAMRWVLAAAIVLFGVVELVVWLGPRPDVGPLVLIWAGLAMPLLAALILTVLVLLVLTLFVALAGILRQARGRAAS
jgi:multisubunit Na+/H+ antiporter MnhC subunit